MSLKLLVSAAADLDELSVGVEREALKHPQPKASTPSKAKQQEVVCDRRADDNVNGSCPQTSLLPID
jgi:hypothetical protein